ncbi:hypothetical protein [Pseudoneobacillus rhizosphaerae]|uniref:hypothetical protein n=1 Tax=Pseudoneobacillus rhizosphaerae TaxID=2880968 RepID=UPI001E2DDC57|nr:hypothetical protein [Pseudoneobacillus rhizosphaerae]
MIFFVNFVVRISGLFGQLRSIQGGLRLNRGLIRTALVHLRLIEPESDRNLRKTTNFTKIALFFN